MFTCPYGCACEDVCVFFLMSMCGVSVQETEVAGGAASHGLLCGMSLPSCSHEMGKHEIKVEKTHKGVEGGRLGPGWG